MERGLSQSDFARLAAKYTFDGTFRRDLVSSYVTGRFAPTPRNLFAMARALKMDPDELFPEAGAVHDGRKKTVRNTISLDTALRVLDLMAHP